MGRQFALTPRDALTILLTVGGLAALRAIRTVDPWIMTHWAFNYEHGFVKRGLVGEIVLRVVGQVTPTIITFLCWVVMLSLAAALICLFIRPALKSQRIGAWMFALIAVTHSATIPHFVFDIGRFDQMGLLILLGCLAILSRPSPVLRLIVLPPLCLIALLIHEAFLFMFLPLIFAVWIFEERWEWIWPKLLVLVGLVASTWAVGTYGVVSNFTPQDYTALLQERYTFKLDEDSVSQLHNGLGRNVANTIENLYFERRAHITQHIVLVLTLLPTFCLFLNLILGLCLGATPVERQWRVLVVAAALAPLALHVLGEDHFRWWSIAITNLFIVFAYLALREHDETTLADTVERSPVIVACILGVSLVFGPLGIRAVIYPLFRGLGFVVPFWTFSS